MVRNQMKLNLNFTFYGVDGFEMYRPTMEIVLSSLGKTSLIKFILAINEAVCNALRYGEGGIEEAKVKINLRFNGKYILAKVSSSSIGFDVDGYIKSFNQKNLDWWELLRKKNRGRGLWIMLTGSQKVIFSADGKEVILLFNVHNPTFNDEKELLTKVRVVRN